MCNLLKQHWYVGTNEARWLATKENWVCRRCGKAVRSVNELIGSKGKITLSQSTRQG